MKIIAKLISVLCCAALTLGALGGCSSGDGKNNGKIKVIASIFPEYDWASNVIGDSNDSVELSLLLSSGTDLHNYQPTADDIVKISDCDVFIYVGGESDKWVGEVLSGANNKDMITLCLLDIIGDSAKEEEVVEGMRSDEEEDEPEYDEHVWLSIRNTELICEKIAESLGEADAENKDKYLENADIYIDKLKSLDEDYKEAVKNAENDTLIFADRFPFRYLTDDYGLKYYAAFAGCSAESEASFETVKFLADKLSELELDYVMTIENSDKKIAQTVINASDRKNAEILTLNSMQAAGIEDYNSGVSYLSIAEDNLKVLKKALGKGDNN